MTPRGGGTGFAGGCVPDGGLVVSLERLGRVRSLDPLLWRMEVEAGVTTQRVQRLARENGLAFPPNPGAAEQSQIGGNIATNAGGPRAFKYGATGAWVTGLEVVVAPGRIVRFGGPLRKDVAGYDLAHLLVGSEGTLGIVTAAWLRLIPAPETAHLVVALYPSLETGIEAVGAAMASGTVPSLIEYLDEATLKIARGSFPLKLSDDAALMIICEADGDPEEAARGRDLLVDALSDGAITVQAPTQHSEIEALWRWREGVPIAVDGAYGGKISEDIGVPLEHLREGIEATQRIGSHHDVAACSWGHAGDGNLHSTFLFDRADAAAMTRAERAADDLFVLAARLGGTVSGEHGAGRVKGAGLDATLSAEEISLMRAVKRAFDPRGLFNPGKKRS